MSDQIEIGAAWCKTSKKGTEYVSIQLRAEAVKDLDLANCFIDMYVNERKQTPGAPDYRIMAKPKQQQSRPQQRQPQRPSGGGFPRPKNFAPRGDSPKHNAWGNDDDGR